MDFWNLLERAAPGLAKYIVWGALSVTVGIRLWRSVSSISSAVRIRFERQDSEVVKLNNLGKRVGRLARQDKRRGLKIALIMQANEEQAKSLDEIKSMLTAVLMRQSEN